MDGRKIVIFLVVVIIFGWIALRNRSDTQSSSVLGTTTDYLNGEIVRKKQYYTLRDGEYDMLPSGSPTIAAYEVRDLCERIYESSSFCDRVF